MITEGYNLKISRTPAYPNIATEVGRYMYIDSKVCRIRRKSTINNWQAVFGNMFTNNVSDKVNNLTSFTFQTRGLSALSIFYLFYFLLCYFDILEYFKVLSKSYLYKQLQLVIIFEDLLSFLKIYLVDRFSNNVTISETLTYVLLDFNHILPISIVD